MCQLTCITVEDKSTSDGNISMDSCTSGVAKIFRVGWGNVLGGYYKFTDNELCQSKNTNNFLNLSTNAISPLGYTTDLCQLYTKEGFRFFFHWIIWYCNY